jgi:hypothetical protein
VKHGIDQTQISRHLRRGLPLLQDQANGSRLELVSELAACAPLLLLLHGHHLLLPSGVHQTGAGSHASGSTRRGPLGCLASR